MMQPDDGDNKTKEIGYNDVLPRFLTDESLCDVTLQGTDGVQVKANRYILAARSEVFHQMLLGSFVEASSPVVEMGYEGHILQAVVEYICTDTAHILNDKKRKKKDKAVAGTFFPSLISLACAGQYYNLPGLSRKVSNAILKKINSGKLSCFEFLEACRSQGPSVPEELSGVALDLVRKQAKSNYEKNADAVTALGSSVLEEILSDSKMEITELGLFKILQIWVEANPGDRTPIAKDWIQKNLIRLEKIPPTELSITVTSSGLVDTMHLFEAYKLQALLAHQNSPDSFLGLRYSSEFVWKNSKSKILLGLGSETAYPGTHRTDQLDCPPISCGLCKWTIQITGTPHLTCVAWFGILAADLQRPMDGWLGWDEAAWGVSQVGYVTCRTPSTKVKVRHDDDDDDECDVTPIDLGESVTITLNLIPGDEGNGTLTWQVEGQQEELALKNLRNLLDKHPRGFIPAASVPLASSIRIELLKFEKLQD